MMMMMMMTVGELVLVLGFLVSARCEVRARDPELEEEDERGQGAGGERGGGGFGVLPPHVYGLQPETATPRERGGYPTRTGNWCTFVHRQVVSTAVACGTETYVVKSQSPCPSRMPACQLLMYKVATRPVYREKQKIITTLLWRCCPGHTGNNCEDAAAQAQILQQQQGDPDREQNDHHAAVSTPYTTAHSHGQPHAAQNPGHAHNTQHPAHHAQYDHDHHNHQDHHDDQDHQHQQDGDLQKPRLSGETFPESGV
ncbi:hypothetical protein LDENG_00114970 [Lucifuga dentata]|nr:hypothetical protein LDENG_00114970 [Lucifuga dentata]